MRKRNNLPLIGIFLLVIIFLTGTLTLVNHLLRENRLANFSEATNLRTVTSWEDTVTIAVTNSPVGPHERVEVQLINETDYELFWYRFGRLEIYHHGVWKKIPIINEYEISSILIPADSFQQSFSNFSFTEPGRYRIRIAVSADGRKPYHEMTAEFTMTRAPFWTRMWDWAETR